MFALEESNTGLALKELKIFSFITLLPGKEQKDIHDNPVEFSFYIKENN